MHLFLDADGTIFRNDSDFDVYNYQYSNFFKFIKENNISVYVVTGRLASELKPIIPFVKGCDIQYIICNNGNSIFDYKKNLNLSDYQDSIHINNAVFTDIKMNLEGQFPFLNLQKPEYQTNTKLCYTFSEANALHIMNHLSEYMQKYVDFHFLISTSETAKYYYFDILYKVSKHSSIQYLTNKLNIKENIMFIGDNGNDIPCFVNIENTILINHENSIVENQIKLYTSKNSPKVVAKDYNNSAIAQLLDILRKEIK